MVANFSDFFNRSTGGLGNDWLEFNVNFSLLIGTTTYLGRFRIGAMFDATQGLLATRHGGTGIQNPSGPAMMVPRLLADLGARDPITNIGVSQFSRITNYRRSAPSGASIASGPAVFLNTGAAGDQPRCYLVNLNSQAGTISGVFGWFGFGAVQGTYYAVISGGVFPLAVADGDVIELRVVPSVGSNFVEILTNGVSRGTANDSNGSRPVFGLPGLFCAPFSSNIGATDQEYKNFVGGPRYW